MATKSLDGLTEGDFDQVFVSQNVLIEGNLTVVGSITGGGGGGGSSDNYFVASDATNQFRAGSSSVELQSTSSSTPTFRLKNNANVTSTSTLEVGQANVINLQSTGISNSGTINTTTMTAGTVNATTANVVGTTTTGTLTATTANVSGNTTTGTFQANSANISGGLVSGSSSCINTNPNGFSSVTLINDTVSNGIIFKNGSTRIGDGDADTMTIRNDAGKLRLYDNTGTGFILDNGTITSPSSLSAFSLTTTSGITGATINSTGNTTVGANLTVTGTTTLNDPFVQNDPLDADDSTPGSVFSWGGLKTVKKVYAGSGVIIPYGQPLQANTAFGATAKMMQAVYDNGVGQDTLQLFTPGASPGSSSSNVMSINSLSCKLPQTTASTSTTTGALQVAGGVGIGGNLHVGGTITGGSVSYTNTSSGTFDVTNNPGTTFTVDSTEQATSTTTGCATFAGGVGVTKNLHVGGTLTAGTVTYATTSTGTMDITNSPGTTLTVDSTEQSTSTTSGAVTVAGGVGIAKNTAIGENIAMGLTPVNGTRYLSLYNSSVDPTAAISVAFDTAATNLAELVMNGPNHPINPDDMILRNLAGNLLLYGEANAGFYVSNGINFSQQTFLVQNSNDALSTNNASVILDGGLGVAKSTRIGQNLYVGETSNNGPNFISISNLSTGVDAFTGIALDTSAVGNTNIFMNGPNRTVDGGANTLTMRNDAGDVRIQSNGSTMVWKSTSIETSKMDVTDTTQSTSITTGAMVVSGGVGIEKQVHIGQQLHCTSTAASTSPTTGCARFSGGIGVSGNVHVGGTIQSVGEVAVETTGAAEMRVYNNGAQTEWKFGQRSVSDHDFTVSSFISGNYYEKMRLNTAGQLKLGSGAFFSYDEGTWTPTFEASDMAGLSVTYSAQSGWYRRIGKQVTIGFKLLYNYTYFGGVSYAFIKGLPSGLRQELQEEVTQVTFRGTFSGITNPYYVTLWRNGYNLSGVNTFDGLTFTVGAYNSGNYITGALVGGTPQSNQQVWSTITYMLP